MREAVIFGASGYSGLELLRLLARHPEARVVAASSDRFAGQSLASHVAQWSTDQTFAPHAEVAEAAPEGGVAFLATPATTSHELAPKLIERGLDVIDLSGGFRLERPADFVEWYGFEHTREDLLGQAGYGLPELFEFPEGRPALVANPGCYATAAIMAVAPLLQSGLLDLDAPIIMDGKSGATGAGRKVSEALMFSDVAETVRPYRLARHQHTPEIERFATQIAGDEVKVSFTAHLLPIRRGLIVSAYARGRAGLDQAAIDAAYQRAYGDRPFVRVVEQPHPGAVVFTNNCDVRAVLDERTGTVLAFGAIDNLGKGAAGQAVQNLNRLLGLPEHTGLRAGGAA